VSEQPADLFAAAAAAAFMKIGAKLIATGFKYWGGGVFCG
jgi:hypothetical protein